MRFASNFFFTWKVNLINFTKVEEQVLTKSFRPSERRDITLAKSYRPLKHGGQKRTKKPIFLTKSHNFCSLRPKLIAGMLFSPYQNPKYDVSRKKNFLTEKRYGSVPPL